MKNSISLWNEKKYNPFRALRSLENEIDEIFNNFPLNKWREKEVGVFNPVCDVTETNSHYVLSFDLPGLKKDEIKLEMEDNVLTISGERKKELSKDEGNNHYFERSYGNFSRSFNLPQGVDSEKIEANYEDGVLNVAIPKKEAAKPKKINIDNNKNGFFANLLGSSEKETKKTK